MTGPEHYRIAQDLALACSKPDAMNPTVRILREHASPDVIALAQVHATLAMAAASATAWFDSGLDEAWRQVAGTPAQVTP